MAVNLSPVAGAAAQFLDNSGNVLTGGKLYTYAAGTTTPQATYTSGAGVTFHSNPIILDAAGRVPAGGEIWLTDGLSYKFVLKDANDVLIGTWDNLIGINSNFLNYYTQQEIQTATAGQTVFTLSTLTYTPGTNSLSVFVDGVNQYDGISYAYVETDSTTVTFTSGLHVGALVKFTTAVTLSSGVTTADLVTYDPPFTASVPTTVELKLAQTVSVKDFGATGDGVTDDTLAIQNAIDSGAKVISFPDGSYVCNTVDVTGFEVTLFGYGAELVCTINASGTGCIKKTDHENKLTVKGISFSGYGYGIYHSVAPATSTYDELLIEDCKFDMNSGAYAIYSIGTREAIITKCYVSNFNGGNGFYFKDSVSPFVNLCVFRGVSNVGTAINYPGTGTGYDAGLVLRDCEILGWATGVSVIGCDWLCIQGSTIDYNIQSIKLEAQDGANISNNYIGSSGVNPALWLTSNVTVANPTFCAKIIVQNNTFTGHYEGGNTYDCILIDGSPACDEIQIVNNNIHFYTRYGVNFDINNNRLFINQNTFGERTGFGLSPIHNATGVNDGSVIIKDNYFANTTTVSAINISSACKLFVDNLGCSTKSSGQITIAVGSYTSTFAHGITGYTPAITDVLVTPVNVSAAAAIPYVFAIDATNVTINTNSIVATSNAGISYQISRYKA